MSELIKVRVCSRETSVAEGTSVAAAILNSGITVFRRSVEGDTRGPLCGMGICYECRVKINGMAHQRACMIACADGMEIETDD